MHSQHSQTQLPNHHTEVIQSHQYQTIIPKSYQNHSNELCQVAKVNESLLSLKYLFPIVERQHKSTAIIKRENINIQNPIFEN